MPNETRKGARAPGAEAPFPEGDDALPPLDFTTFVLSLSTTVLASLGEIPAPDGGHPETNLPLARQTIDLLVLLSDKTKGNLTGEEERLLNQVLLDLRMKFVAATTRSGGKKK